MFMVLYVRCAYSEMKTSIMKVVIVTMRMRYNVNGAMVTVMMMVVIMVVMVMMVMMVEIMMVVGMK